MLSNIYKDAYQRVLFLTGICPIHETKTVQKCNKKVKSEHFLSLRDMLNFFSIIRKRMYEQGFTYGPERGNFDEKTVFLQSVKYGLPLPVHSGYEKRRGTRFPARAADPSMILFQGKYYIFASMTLSVWVSEDMVHWESHRLPESLPLYDYAPDVRVIGDYVYFSASRRGTICDFYRTKDILNGPFEAYSGNLRFLGSEPVS